MHILVLRSDHCNRCLIESKEHYLLPTELPKEFVGSSESVDRVMSHVDVG